MGEPKPLIYLGCVDLPGPEGCCTSCHDDADEAGMDMCSVDVPDNKRHRESRVEGDVCCRVKHEVTRDEVAAAVRAKRARER
jgi:hypothetical protein